MSKSDEIKKLLDRMRAEVGPVEEPRQEPQPEEEPRQGRPPIRRSRFVPRGSRRPDYSFFEETPEREHHREPAELKEPLPRHSERPSAHDSDRNTVWDENKEILLFGMLASLTAALGGLLADVGFLVIAGTVLLSFFSLLTGAALLMVVFLAKRGRAESSGITERVDALSKRVEMLSRQSVASSLSAQVSTGEADPELARKVEELRVMVKGLSRALEEDR